MVSFSNFLSKHLLVPYVKQTHRQVASKQKEMFVRYCHYTWGAVFFPNCAHRPSIRVGVITVPLTHIRSHLIWDNICAI